MRLLEQVPVESAVTQEADHKEWSTDKKWNPFNSYKLLAQVYRWRLIRPGLPVPQPGLVTVDPINACNLSCKWCNADFVLGERQGRISRNALLDLADGLARWKGSPDWPAGVEAVCIAGGGEPLLHPNVGEFIEACAARGIEVGVVTNGTTIHKHIEALSMCTWVGVSVDAGSAASFAELKGRDLYGTVCENIQSLNDYARAHDCTLGMDRPGYGVSYKYLLYNGNLRDVYSAARTARDLGCRNFHLRPAGIAWDKIHNGPKRLFDDQVKDELAEQIRQARALESRDFGVFGITHKFDGTLNRANQFRTCHAVFMTCVFMPPRPEREENLCVGLCCDRRGDARLEFSGPVRDFADVESAWGGPEHWAVHERINLAECPRCTYQPHNQIYEHVIQDDSMTYKFI